MLRILLATDRPEALRSFTEALNSDPRVSLTQVVTGSEVLSVLRELPPHLVVIDHGLSDYNSLDLVREMLMVNAMAGAAVLSPLSDEEFHEVSEGLGILGRLPLEPREGDAAELLDKIGKVLGGTS